MFGKKKNIIKVCHYEGLHDFAQDYPCEIEITEDNLENYITNIEKQDFDKNRIIDENQDFFSKEKEYMLLGLRKIEGISIKDFKNNFSENPIFIFKDELNKLVNEGLIQINSDYIKLTNKGLDLANIVWEEFV